MNRSLLEGIAFVLMLLALPFASLGTAGEMQVFTILALGVMAIGGVTLPVLKIAGKDDDKQDAEDKSR